MTASERIVRLLIKVLSNPYRFKKKELADFFERHEDRIKDDFETFRNIGLHVEIKKNRYAIIPDKEFKELSYLQELTEGERAIISKALYKEKGTKEAEAINRKLANLFNFQKLGLRALRRPALDRIDILQLAKKENKQVILENYRSNSSNEVRNRHIEVFRIDTALDTIQAVDIDEIKKGKDGLDVIKHFRLSRIDRVLMTQNKWQHRKLHIQQATDVFRIANENQVRVHLRINVQAYNYLHENYPKALSEIHPSSDPKWWDFETAINADFYGLTNFIMANSAHVEIVYPAELKEVIRRKALSLIEKLG